MKTMYALSYVSNYCDELYNKVEIFNNKKEIIETANQYIEDINSSVMDECVTKRNFDDYSFGCEEIEVSDYIQGNKFMVSITEFEV